MGLLVLPLLWRAIDADPAVRDLSRARRDPSWPQATISEARVTVMRADRGSRCSLRPVTANVRISVEQPNYRLTSGGEEYWPARPISGRRKRSGSSSSAFFGARVL